MFTNIKKLKNFIGGINNGALSYNPNFLTLFPLLRKSMPTYMLWTSQFIGTSKNTFNISNLLAYHLLKDAIVKHVNSKMNSFKYRGSDASYFRCNNACKGRHAI